MIKKKSSHFICTWQWLMLSSETMRRKLEIQKLEQVFKFFHFHSYLPYFLNIKSSWIRMNIFEIYLLLLTAEDGWCFHTWSGAISWIRPLSLLGRTYSPGCRIGGSLLISYSVGKRALVLCVAVKDYLSVSTIQISPVPWVNASKSIQSCVLQQ